MEWLLTALVHVACVAKGPVTWNLCVDLCGRGEADSIVRVYSSGLERRYSCDQAARRKAV